MRYKITGEFFEILLNKADNPAIGAEQQMYLESFKLWQVKPSHARKKESLFNKGCGIIIEIEIVESLNLEHTT